MKTALSVLMWFPATAHAVHPVAGKVLHDGGGLVDVKVRVGWEIDGVSGHYLTRTDAAGDWSVEVTEDDPVFPTKLSVYYELRSYDVVVQSVANDAALTHTVAGHALVEQEVAEDELADFGEVDLATVDGLHEPATVWKNYQQMIGAYVDHVGPWPLAGEMVFIGVGVGVLPPDGGAIAHAHYGSAVDGPSDIHLWRQSWDDRRVLQHETGHILNAVDAVASLPLPSLCGATPASVWPMNTPPYVYVDPDATGPDPCLHTASSWEADGRALSEGFASFFGLVVSGALNGREPSCEEPRALWMDTDNNEANVTQVLCDLVDSSQDETTALHAFANVGRLVPVHGPIAMASPGSGPNAAWWIDGGDLWSATYSGTAVPSLLHSFPVSLHNRPRSDGATVCTLADPGLYGDDTLECVPTSGGAPWSVDVPELTLVDHALVGGASTVLVGSGSGTEVYSARLPAPGVAATWVSEGQFSAGAGAVAHDGIGTIYVGDGGQVHRCETGLGCSLWLGDALLTGYDRETRVDALFSGIRQLDVVGDDLFIVDDYGVARIDTRDLVGSPPVEPLPVQLVAGAEDRFHNNLAARALAWGPDDGFATDGVGHVVFQQAWPTWDDARVKQLDPQVVFVEPTEVETVHHYCESEDATYPADDIVRSFLHGTPNFATLHSLLSDLVGSGVISNVDADDVERLNWIRVEQTAVPCPLRLVE